jgi:CubicO group peptidase (beta-lactamase class C family)
MTSFRKLFLLSLVTAFTLVSCGDPVNPTPVLSDAANLNSVSFSTVDNPSMSVSAHSTPCLGYLAVTVPEGSNISALKATYYVSDGAEVLIKGQKQVSGQTINDFSNIVDLQVVSESGKVKKDYVLYVKTGNASVDAQFYQFMNKHSVPGVSFSVMRGEKVVYTTGYGYAVTESRIKTTPDHLFRLASISKQFTTLCIMVLYERGMLGIDDKVFGENGILKKEFKTKGMEDMITVRHLLQHSAGWTREVLDPMFSSVRNGKTLDELLQWVLDNQNLKFTPGSNYEYSNVGFSFLGRIVEVVSGKPFETFLKEDVLKPMGVTDIHVGGGQDERRPNECVYYSQDGTNGYGNPMQVIAACGGIIASTNQMMTVLAHIDGRDGVPDILKPETLDLMYNSEIDPNADPSTNLRRYGLGWRRLAGYYPGAHWHGGNIAGTATIWVGNTNAGMSAAILCNSRSYDKSIDGDMQTMIRDLMEVFQ